MSNIEWLQGAQLQSYLSIDKETQQTMFPRMSTQIRRLSLFFGCQNHLLSLTPTRDRALLAMLPLVLLSSFDRVNFFSFDLASFLDGFGNMTMTFDTADFWHMTISGFQSLVILKLLALARRLYIGPGRGVRSPQPYIPIVRSSQDVLAVGSEFGREDSAEM